MYGYLPQCLTYMPGTTQIAAVEEQLKSRDKLVRLWKENLDKSQNRMKKYADLRRTERNLEVVGYTYDCNRTGRCL
jgi:hypothetical protein